MREAFISIFRYSRSNRKRFTLSLLGVAIGVFSLTLMMGVTGAMKEKIRKSLGELGTRVIVVIPGDIKVMGGRVLQLSFYPTLTIKDAMRVESKCPLVMYTSPFKKVSPNVHAKGKSVDVSVMGVNDRYEFIADFHPICGRFISSSDIDSIAQVAVVGYDVARKVYGRACPVGETIFLYNAPYRIVGVMEPKGTDASGKNLDEMIFIPITSAVKRISNVDYVDGMYVLPVPGTSIKDAMKQIESLLLNIHGKRDFTVNAYEDLVNVQKKAMHVFTVLSITVSTIAFGVGALGILAVVTLSIYERLVEIGIKRAFGAARKDIFKQFLIESVVLSSLGAVAGVVPAAILTIVIARFAGWSSFFVPFKGIVVSSLLSTCIGVFAGIYPAMRASSFEPVDVLREV